ncbi:YhcN/YlaJ family sporulation lipoprotein [Alicyclobacillus sp.]|uniref:YhcN/YlaJ family sporulation lipoprotein n=1 Tax=Alicyclobacillus sp. TaxID=61169 RepID=UPI0025BFEC64|nr:YhcN/YlaJ family sporulation lipoprotein [Alicyclobacillus sp.]MCL6515852.1 YhcN/YlaJ family sporulation lipoprotein [Alicyclobacillus sp.]
MRTRTGWLGALAVLGVLSLAGCREHPPLQMNQAGGSVEQQFDRREVDVDGDGDRAKLSGYNDTNNPQPDPRSVSPAHGAGTTLTHGRYAGNAEADRVAQLALNIPHVRSAAAVAAGRVILIGVDLARAAAMAEGGGPDFNHIQREIRRRVLTQAPEFRYVYVTRDPAQVREINRIADGLRSGQPLSAYRDRMAALMRQMQPVPWS